MKCSFCGNELPANAAFCNNCGNKIVSAQKRHCGNCGAELRDGVEFCGRCGWSAVNNNRGAGNRQGVSAANTQQRRYTAVIIVLASVLVLMAAGIFGYFCYTGFESENAIQATATPLPTATPEATATPAPTVQPASYVTYYVVNCNTSISLRETPSTSAVVLKEVPLGSPVSYVEPAQNGFAKIIYNGMTGYALQSYLSSNPNDVKKPNVLPDGPIHDNPNVKNTTYETYYSSQYSFSCAYPSNFTKTGNNDPFVLCSYKSPDASATLNICGTNNTSSLSVQTVLDNFKSSFPGAVDYQDSGSDWCVCRTCKNGTYHYGYFKLTDGKIRGFEFHFDGSNYSVYDSYINYIYNSLIFR